jgi:hypothetical protein
MDFNDILRMIQGGGPASTVMDAQAAAPPQQAPQAPPPTAPQGIPTSVTNPAPAAQTPQAYQSPPDLANMYIELMKKNQNAQQLDSGMNLIAAGLSNSPANRAALISASGQHGSGGMSLSASDMINFQKQAEAQKQQLIMQQAIPALIKQYKLTPAQAQALVASGQMGDVLKHYSTENLGSAVDAASGKHILFNQRTGQQIATLGGEKEDPSSWHDGPNGPELRNDLTGDRIGGAGIGIKATDTKRQFDEFNKSLVDNGKPPMNEMEFLKMAHPGAAQTHVNVSPSGAVFEKPEPGFAYERNPDNTVKIDAQGHPILYRITGSAAADEAADKVKKDQATLDKEAKAKVQAVFGASNVAAQVDEALKHVDTPGVVGIGSRLMRNPNNPAAAIGGLPHDVYDSALKTIQSNVTIDTLARMRAASPTGGALGNVSDFEDKMLQSVIGPLNTYTSPAEARKGLIRVKAAMELLANDNFNKDPEKFKAALEQRTMELSNSGAKSGVKVERVKPNG